MLNEIAKVVIWAGLIFFAYSIGVVHGTRHADPHACVSVCVKEFQKMGC